MDTIDQSVLSCLLADGRATYAEIGAEVGLSAPAVKRRVDKLRETGAIRGFTKSCPRFARRPLPDG